MDLKNLSYDEDIKRKKESVEKKQDDKEIRNEDSRIEEISVSQMKEKIIKLTKQLSEIEKIDIK